MERSHCEAEEPEEKGRWKRVLSSDDLSKAVFVDFEARSAGPEALLGVLTPRGDFKQFVTDPVLWPASASGRSDSTNGLRCVPSTIEAAVSAVVLIARALGGPIIGFSLRELEAVRHSVPAFAPAWEELYVDGKYTAKRWHRTLHSEVVFEKRRGYGRYTLDQFLGLAGYEVPKIHGPGNTGQRLAYVRGQLSDRGEFALLTKAAKTKWSNLLAHNYHDVHGLRWLLQVATSELEAHV